MQREWTRSKSVFTLLLSYHASTLYPHARITHTVVSRDTKIHYSYTLYRPEVCKTNITLKWYNVIDFFPTIYVGNKPGTRGEKCQRFFTWDPKMNFSLCYAEIKHTWIQSLVVCHWLGFPAVGCRSHWEILYFAGLQAKVFPMGQYSSRAIIPLVSI